MKQVNNVFDDASPRKWVKQRGAKTTKTLSKVLKPLKLPSINKGQKTKS